MLFNSIKFLCFFPIAASLYFFCIHVLKKNWINQLLLLVASLYFYMCWHPAYVILILISILITWYSGILLEGNKKEYKKIILAISLISNLAILFFFKYCNFFTASIKIFAESFNLPIRIPRFNILLPVGISFYTFQALGYSIDVYNEKIKAERNIITYALFVTFFPQLVAGPIERSGNLLDQFKVNHEFDYDRVTDGLKLAAWGMFKKVVIADTLAIYVDRVYNDINTHGNIAAALATFFFAFQILCDFSGYSDIAIGTAKVLGFNLMQNFRRPYFAKTIGDFWRRWHISLSSWFKDYVYIPLGGNKVSAGRYYFNILLTFLISGLWHGAGWNFVFWGLLHGTALVISNSTDSIRKCIRLQIKINEKTTVYKIWQILCTWLFVYITWVFFRSHSIRDALIILHKIIYFPADIFAVLKAVMTGTFALGGGFFNNITLGMSKLQFLKLFLLIGILLINDILARKKSMLIRVKTFPFLIRWIGYYALVLSIFFTWLGTTSVNSQFIYFQF